MLGKEIGHGSSGTVYNCEGENKVIKIFSARCVSAQRDHFKALEEALSKFKMAKFFSLSIESFIDYSGERPIFCQVFEKIQGINLSNYMKENCKE